MKGDSADPQDLLWVVAGLVGLIVVGAAIPTVVTLVHSFQLPETSFGRLVMGTLRIVTEARWDNPAAAYPAEVGAAMPAGKGWWVTCGGAGIALAAIAGYGARRFGPSLSRERLARRPGDWRGSRPRSWARPRDIVVRRRDAGFTIGRLDGRVISSHEEEHVALVAPTRAGKTTRFVIPWLLEHRGAAIVTSTKRDVLDATREARANFGRVWIFDPFSGDSARWTPLDGCADWSRALSVATWLADATQDGDSEIARYWRGEASKLLAPLLHAAALSKKGSIADVITWLDLHDTTAATRVLASRHATPAAQRQIESVNRLDSRNKGTTFMSAGSVLAAYRYPKVLATALPDLSAATFATGQPHTVYVVAAERHQRLLAPLIVALLSDLINAAMERDRYAKPGAPRLRVLLDEAANIAPLVELPRMLSQAAGHGIRVATVWQSLGQMRERYPRSADTILANSTSKVFLGPVTDDTTRSFVVDLLGRTPDGDDHKASAASLQQLGGDRALVLRGNALPTIVRTRPWWVGGLSLRGRRGTS